MQSICIFNNVWNKSVVDLASTVYSLLSYPVIQLHSQWIINSEWLSPIFINLFKTSVSKIKTIHLSDFSENGWIYDSMRSNNYLTTIILSYGIKPSAYFLYKFLINSGIINSIEQIYFERSWDIDLNELLKLVFSYTI